MEDDRWKNFQSIVPRDPMRKNDNPTVVSLLQSLVEERMARVSVSTWFRKLVEYLAFRATYFTDKF